MRTAFNFMVGGMFLGAVATYGICKEDIEAGKKASRHNGYYQKWYTDADFSKETDKE